MSAAIGLTFTPQPTELPVPEDALPGQIEQLTLEQKTRQLSSMIAEAGPRHQGAKVAGVVGHPATTVVSSRGFRADKYDIIHTKPDGLDKQGKHGDLVNLQSNYFALKKECDWCLYSHSVTFSIEIDSIGFRKKILHQAREKKEIDCSFIYDGTTLYTSKELSLNVTYDDLNNRRITAEIKSIHKLVPGDSMYMHFYNVLLRKCLFGLKLEQMGRNFYNPGKGIRFAQHKLELWPGYITAIRSHEKEVLLCVEVTHKVVRLESCLEIIRKLQSQPGDYRQNVTQAMIGAIVLTSYNNKTYRIADVEWNMNPKSTFEKNGEQMTFVDYFKSRYDTTITDFGQPLLLMEARKKDLHAGRKERILLVPETCQLTGLTDDMRANFSLMKTLAEHLHMIPPKRIDSIKSFMRQLQSTDDLTKEMNGWGLQFSNDLTKCRGRVLPREGIVFGPGGDGKPERANEKADWTMAFRKRQMLKCINLEKWSILVPQRDAQNIDNLVKVMMQVGKPLGLNIRPPTDVIKIPDGRSGSYLQALDTATKKDLQLLFVILPNNKLDLYSVIKKRLSVNLGIPSQCFLAKNLTNKGLMSIATKVVVQMNAKLGGEPWSIQIPLKNTMITGFDAYRGGGATKVGERSAIGALVATVNGTFSKYFSTVSNHKGLEELGTNLALDMNKCLDVYSVENGGKLPERIIMYRDGVGDGQLRLVYDVETQHIKKSLYDYYDNAKVQQKPTLTYIVVTKRINTRIFNIGSNENPGPGTIVDSTITLPERYDFYMVTAAARQGTVSPCSYNVVVDDGDLDADKLQRITYKMCHMYYNWSGTVAVPAPCQYAHKLAFLTGMALGSAPAEGLSNKLHFL